MATLRSYRASFNGGEVAPSLYARLDNQRYQTGLAQCKNFLVEPQGPIQFRPGFVHVNEVKDSSHAPQLIPFSFSTEQTLVLEFGDHYVRFHTLGKTVLDDGGQPYEVETPYSADEVFDIHYVQSADVMTLVHPNHPPMELRRYGATDWRFVEINFGAPLPTPKAPSVEQHINSSTSNPEDYVRKYAITALNEDGTEESAISPATSIQCNPYGDGAYNTISWQSVSGAARYRIYRDVGGLWAYIGETTSLSIDDDNIDADSSITPPIYGSVFDDGDYPGAVSYFEQRRWFGGTPNKPNNLWATRSGTESNMSYSLPTQDDDRIAVRVAAREANRIRHIVPLSQLMLLTGAAEWRVSPLNSDAITPSSMSVRPQSYVGANGVQPLVVNNQMLYAAERGGHLRECGYSYEAGGYVTNDVCMMAPHLFDNLGITAMTYSKAPWPIAWCVSTSGKLIAFTYVPEQRVGAFSTIETAGVFESCCSVAEGDEDALYVVVRREINGQTKRFIERMHERQFKRLEDCVFMDCAGTYDGDPTQDVSGLDWLEGQEVAILADGSVEPTQVVTNGAIHIAQPASKIHVGLPYVGDVRTLPLAVALQDGSYGTSHRKNVREVYFRVVDSSGLKAGPSFDRLATYPPRSTEFAGDPPETITDEFGFVIPAAWGAGGQVCIRQDEPLTLRIISMTTVFEMV